MDELDAQLSATLAQQHRALRNMTQAQRYRYFEKMFLMDFQTDIGNTTYVVCQHYSPAEKETLTEKAERIVNKSL